MIKVAKEWNPKQSRLREIILNPEKIDEAIKLCLEMHKKVHSSEMSKCSFTTYEDRLWDGLSEELFRVVPLDTNNTIAWNIWHITRIEDIASNILIADGNQVFDKSWMDRLNAAIRDTGNAMNRDEIREFSNKIKMDELKNYRIETGRRTQKIISGLKPPDLKREMTERQLKRLYDEGCVLDVEGSSWLADFWGRKKVAGILLMPITRHQVVHLNKSLKIRERYIKSDGKSQK